MTPSDADTHVQESIRTIDPLPEAPEPEDLDLHDKSLYIGRELSWLDFNDRVLQLAEEPSMPLLERVKMAAIWSSNLDEFFQIRVAGVHEQIDAGLAEPGPDGLTPVQTVDAIRESVVRPAAAPRGSRHRRAVRRSSPSTGSASSGWTTSPSRSARGSPSASAARSSRR